MTTRDMSPPSSLPDPVSAGEETPSRRRDEVLVASPSDAIRVRLAETLRDLFPVSEVSSWETLDRTISSRQPAVVLLDRDLLTASGVNDLSIIRRISRKANIVILSGRPRDSEAIDALKAGARGYCDRNLEDAMLRKAAEKVRDGEVWAERRLIPLFIEEQTRGGGDRPERRVRQDQRLALLTRREREIAHWIGSGASNRDIAARLAVGEGTVKAHLTAIFRKLGFSDRLQLGLFLVNPNWEEPRPTPSRA